MNLSIPDAAAELAVSESRLRRTLVENSIPTLVEFRQTRTGVRKTTVLNEEAIAKLHAHFAAPSPISAAGSEPAGPQEAREADLSHATEASFNRADETRQPCAGEPPPASCESLARSQSVPIAQFNALLYQHNVLREELSRVTEYLDGCDRLLGEMVRTIAALEERTRQLEPERQPAMRSGNPLSGALRTVSAGFQNALFSRSTAKPMMKPAEVYYSNILASR